MRPGNGWQARLKVSTTNMAEIRPSEISEILKNEIKGFEGSISVRETGRVLSCGDGIARIYGLQNAALGELLEFPHQMYGMALNLEEDNVGAVLFGDPQAIQEGDEVKRTGRIAEVPVGEALLGRVVNALGQPIDDKGPIKSTDRRRRDRVGSRSAAVPRALHRLHDGRISSRQRPACAAGVRRSQQARAGLSTIVAAVAPPARPRGVSRRRLLSAFAIARARRQD